MSGLFGVVDFAAPRVEPEGFRRLAELGSYRAPGGITCHFLGNAGLAYLALREGDRPLHDPQRQICVLLDGRLDNRPELLARLSPARGAEASDAELLLAAYLEWDETCTDRLLGDFALAVWDARRRRLLCAVDPLGIKPLHYAQVGSLVCFASDAVQVLHHPAVPDSYNEVEIAAYLGRQCEDPGRSFFSAIHKLAPAHRLVLENGRQRLERYWFPSPREIRYSRDEDYTAHFLEILRQAVTDRVRDAGSFVGIAMSGGLDSTSVAALAQRAPGARVQAYSFVFDQLPECDERSYSREMTGELGLAVETVGAESLWSLESQAAVLFSPDTPFVGWRTCYQEILRRMAARGSRVMLMGHGGDDLLRGSSLVYAERLRRGDLTAVGEVVRHARRQGDSVLRAFYRQFARPHLPAGADRLLRAALGKREDSLPAWMDPGFARRTRPASRPSGPRSFAGSARREVYRNLVGSPWYWRLANWHDRTSAAFGIEVRHPFLDRRLFEYVLAIPGEQLFRLDVTKSLLRRSMREILPERIRSRQGKTRFTPFLDSVLRERAAGEITELLRSPRAVDLEVFDRDRLQSAYLDFLGGREESRRALWYAITLEIWLRRCEVIRKSSRRVPGGERAAA
ncbi:MAG: asparagine synthetase B family protein [Thermoanaerobaculia bacterium]